MKAHRFWYGTRGPALANETLLIELTYLSVNPYAREEHTCVILTDTQIQFVDCRVTHNAHFACVSHESRVKSNSEEQIGKCPSRWEIAQINRKAIGNAIKSIEMQLQTLLGIKHVVSALMKAETYSH